MTNKWTLDTDPEDIHVIVVRVQDAAPIFEMFYAHDSEEKRIGLMNHEEAINVAQQIVDDWNFSHE